MAERILILALEGDPERAAILKGLVESTGEYEFLTSKSARKLVAAMDGKRPVGLIMTNTRVTADETDGLRFIRALYLKYQGIKQPLPPIVVCSSDQAGDIVQQYAFRFAEPPLISYVLIRKGELKMQGDKVLQVIARALGERQKLEESIPENREAEVKRRLRRLLKQTIALPNLPDVAVRVQSALKDPEITFKKLAQVIATDLTLGANVIKLANSPQYGVSGTIATVEEACKQVGLNAIANTVVAAKVFDSLDELPTDFDLRTLRRHSYAVATIARIVGRRCHVLRQVSAQIQFSGTMFAAGMLHDIGKVLMTQYFASECAQIVKVVDETRCSMVEAETEVVGVSHADAGLYAGIEWTFPVILVNVIGRHHWPLDLVNGRLKTRQGKLAQRVIRIADAASYEMGFGMVRSDQQPPVLSSELFEHTGLDRDEFGKWAKEIADDIAYTFEVLGKV